MFVVCGKAAIRGADSPAIVLQHTSTIAGGDDRFDGDHEAFGEAGPGARVVEIGYARRLVNTAADAVTAEFAHDLEAATVRLLLDRAADFGDAVAGARNVCSAMESSFRAAHQGSRGIARVINVDGDRSVSEIAVLFRDEVEFHEVAGVDNAITGNAVNRFVVDADAERGRKSVDFGRSGFSA